MKKIITTLAILTIATSIIGMQNTFATNANTKKELCKMTFNAKLSTVDEGCVIGYSLKYNNYIKKIQLKFGKKNISGDKFLKIIDKYIEKKYKKIGAKGTGLVRAKEMFYEKIMKAVGNKFERLKKGKTKDLFGDLYIVLSVGKTNLAKEYSEESSKKANEKQVARYGTTNSIQTIYIRLPSGEVIELKQSLLLHPTIRSIMQDEHYQQPTGGESSTYTTRYVGKMSDLNKKVKQKVYHRDATVADKSKVHQVTKTHSTGKLSEGFFSTGVSAERIEEAEHAKARATSIEFQKLSKYEQQIKLAYMRASYVSLSPSSEVSSIISGEKRYYDKILKGPTKRDNLVFKHKVDDYNIYAGLLLDGGLVNYDNELVKQTAFYRVYVGPYYGDTDGTWRTGTEYGVASKDVLAYFGYSMNEDPMSKDYLELKYDASKNKFKKTGTINYIKNTYK